MNSNKKMVLGIVLAAMIYIHSYANTKTYHCPDTNSPLQDRISWAEKNISKINLQSGCYIGYSIQKKMRKNSWMGCFHCDGFRRATLREVLNGVEIIDHDNDQETIIHSNMSRSDHDKDNPIVLKDVAILFQILSSQNQLKETSKIKITNMDQHADLNEMPILWLGQANQDESLDLLMPLYSKIKHEDEKEDLIVAVSMHDQTERVISFLEDRLKSNEPEEIREDATFWLGQQNDKRALIILKKLIDSDQSMKVREKAVFAISQMTMKEAETILIDLAYHAKPDKIKKQAIFWLGQKASEKATEALKDVVFNIDETELQEHAVFALSQQDNDFAVPQLIKIVKTHPNPEIRKKAIFWLGETGDPRVVDVLVDMVRK
ncbi:HEAT repeat domain-containing protein [bacterium]